MLPPSEWQIRRLSHLSKPSSILIIDTSCMSINPHRFSFSICFANFRLHSSAAGFPVYFSGKRLSKETCARAAVMTSSNRFWCMLWRTLLRTKYAMTMTTRDALNSTGVPATSFVVTAKHLSGPGTIGSRYSLMNLLIRSHLSPMMKSAKVAISRMAKMIDKTKTSTEDQAWQTSASLNTAEKRRRLSGVTQRNSMMQRNASGMTSVKTK
mmetsp:Transcript_28102/g.38502  ORF Transcript_28102/g.38502 Transcript_28102/m.38502 type:complete len:210 (-) Transcript_28102:438-1067(-)